ncbi:multicopper oxidase domain-containing protein [Cupriavidus cauae]|nr:multicopper oxidase domain-containing protein [Cupriavidus cauae]UZN50028.1 multicopper oxidase domain-containing protein [Cupriavidus cauae]
MGVFGVNGRPFDMEPIDAEIRRGDTEVWQVSPEMMAHPFHIHCVHFEVLSRNGSPPGVRDKGLCDTNMVENSVELLVRFCHTAVTAPYMYDRHILEHEDNGRMGQFIVR